MIKKLTIFQIITIITFVIFLIWEKNIQEYLTANKLENTGETRVDLLVILPVLGVMMGISIWQFFKKL